MELRESVIPGLHPQLRDDLFSESLLQGTRTVVGGNVPTMPQRLVVITALCHGCPSPPKPGPVRNRANHAHNVTLLGIVRPLSLDPWDNGSVLTMADEGGRSLKADAQLRSRLGTTILQARRRTDRLPVVYSQRHLHKDIKSAHRLIHPTSTAAQVIDVSMASRLAKETRVRQSAQPLAGTLADLTSEPTGRMNRDAGDRTNDDAPRSPCYPLPTGDLPWETDDLWAQVHGDITRVALSVQGSHPIGLWQFKAVMVKRRAKNAEARCQSALDWKYPLEQCPPGEKRARYRPWNGAAGMRAIAVPCQKHSTARNLKSRLGFRPQSGHREIRTVIGVSAWSLCRGCRQANTQF